MARTKKAPAKGEVKFYTICTVQKGDEPPEPVIKNIFYTNPGDPQAEEEADREDSKRPVKRSPGQVFRAYEGEVAEAVGRGLVREADADDVAAAQVAEGGEDSEADLLE